MLILYGLVIGIFLSLLIYLIDPSQISFNVYFLIMLVAVILLATKAFSMIVGNMLSKRKIIDEVSADNK